MPYLNYEIYENQVEMKEAIRNADLRDSSRWKNFEALLGGFQDEESHPLKTEGTALSRRESQSSGSNVEGETNIEKEVQTLSKEVQALSKEIQALSYELDVKLVEVYLNHKSPLHIRR